MQLTWKASKPASTWHAAWALATGCPVTAPGLAEVLDPVLENVPPTADGSVRLLAMLAERAAAGVDQDRALAEQTLARLRGRQHVTPTSVAELAAWIAQVRSTCDRWYQSRSQQPLVDEVTLRSAPLRSQWDARGPGLLRALGRLTEPWLLVERAEVVLVLPAVGGHGTAHLATNTVTFEAVLANADQTLPEVVRLGWLLAQLQFDLPAIGDRLQPAGGERLAPLAMLPPVLVAASEVELAEYSPAALARAAVHWRIARSAAEAESLTRVLDRWWSTYVSHPTDWPVALAALEQMAGGA